MHVEHPLGWYIMWSPWLHDQPWFSLLPSSVFIGERS
jgi:hypothetical protein